MDLNIALWFRLKLFVDSKSENECPQRFLLYSTMKGSWSCETTSDQNALRGKWSGELHAVTDKINQDSLLNVYGCKAISQQWFL